MNQTVELKYVVVLQQRNIKPPYPQSSFTVWWNTMHTAPSLCEIWLYPSWFCSHLFLIHQQYTCTSALFRTEGPLGFLPAPLCYPPPTQSQDLAPALALLGQGAGPCHQRQIAVLIGRIPQICYTLKPCASQQAWFPVREGVEAVAAVVGAHSTGTWRESDQTVDVGRIIPLVQATMHSNATSLPTPPKGRATIRLCTMLSLAQKLPLEVSVISLEMTCQRGQHMIRIHIGRIVLWIQSVFTVIPHVPCCCWNMRTHRGVSLAY